MSDILAAFGILILTGLAFPGLLTAWALLFPNVVERARRRVERTPWATFGMGLAGMAAAVIPIFILLSLPLAPAKFLGWVGIFTALTFASIGASGIAAHLGGRMTRLVEPDTSEMTTLVWGAVVFELAAAFPILGWFVITPLWIITSMGAASFAVLRWMPRAQDVPESTPKTLAGYPGTQVNM